MPRARMLREQARLLRDLAQRDDLAPEIRERLRKIAEQCDELANDMERSPARRR